MQVPRTPDLGEKREKRRIVGLDSAGSVLQQCFGCWQLILSSQAQARTAVQQRGTGSEADWGPPYGILARKEDLILVKVVIPESSDVHQNVS